MPETASQTPYTPHVAGDALEGLLRDALAPNLLLVREIGAGGMARVFLAREPALKRLVAVKVLSGELAKTDAGRARFEREAQAVAALSHPNIVFVHSVGELSDGMPYFIMQYVDGRSMAQRIEQEGPLSMPEARRALGEVAAALAAAHKQGRYEHHAAAGGARVPRAGHAGEGTPDIPRASAHPAASGAVEHTPAGRAVHERAIQSQRQRSVPDEDLRACARCRDGGGAGVAGGRRGGAAVGALGHAGPSAHDGVIGARFRLPFSADAQVWGLPIPPYSQTKLLAYASVSRAAHHFARGELRRLLT